MPTIRTTWWSVPAGSPSRKASPRPASASSSSPACRSVRLVRRTLCALRLSAQGRKTSRSNILPLDLLGQGLDHLADVLEMRIDGKRAAVGFERVLVVGELLGDIVLEEVDGGALVPGFDIAGVDRDDGIEKLDGEIEVLVVGRRLDPAHQQI